MVTATGSACERKRPLNDGSSLIVNHLHPTFEERQTTKIENVLPLSCCLGHHAADS